MPNSQPTIFFYKLIFGFIIIFLLIVLGAFFLHLAEFLQELRYLNKEISSTVGAERKHWIRRRRRLWLSLLPFVHY